MQGSEAKPVAQPKRLPKVCGAPIPQSEIRIPQFLGPA
jgi:hypothetical protein